MTNVKPASSTQLAYMYGVTLHTFLRWIEPFRDVLGTQIARTWTVKQVEIIFDKLGKP